MIRRLKLKMFTICVLFIHTKLHVGVACLIGNLLNHVESLMEKILPSDLKQLILLKCLMENIQGGLIQVLRHTREVVCDE